MATRKYRKHPRGNGWLPLAPKVTPSVEMMLDDIGASAAAVALHLGVDGGTVERWRRGEVVPRRSVCLALFYETKWGRDFVHTAAHNDAIFYGRAAVWLEGEVQRLRRVLAAVGRLGEFGSANDPSPEVRLSSEPSRVQLRVAVSALPPELRRRVAR